MVLYPASSPSDAPTTPAPLPPRVDGPRVLARRQRRRLAVAELVLAVVFVGGAALFDQHRAPAPLPPAVAWRQRAGPAVAELAADLARASADPSGASVAPTLRADGARLERAGPPPEEAARAAWATTLSEVSAAAAATGSARAQLASQAGLALVGLDVAVHGSG